LPRPSRRSKSHAPKDLYTFPPGPIAAISHTIHLIPNADREIAARVWIAIHLLGRWADPKVRPLETRLSLQEELILP